MISVSRYPENILDDHNDILRSIPKISHDISRILDTILNTTSEQFRNHKWGNASLGPGWLYTPYTAVVPIVLGFLNPQHPEPAESTSSLPEQSNHMGRIDLEPSQATESKYWSPHSVLIRVRIRVRVEWS